VENTNHLQENVTIARSFRAPSAVLQPEGATAGPATDQIVCCEGRRRASAKIVLSKRRGAIDLLERIAEPAIGMCVMRSAAE
jgi:hypothetical protein